MKYILGIDPGLSGALARWDGRVAEIIDMPTIEVKVGKAFKRQLDLYALAGWLYTSTIDLCVIEHVGSMPGQGVTSSFNFGFTAGGIQGVVAASQIPVLLVRPQVWKRAYGLIGQDKDASRAAASRLAPHVAHNWPLKKHDGRAEAFLLAAYGMDHNDSHRLSAAS